MVVVELVEDATRKKDCLGNPFFNAQFKMHNEGRISDKLKNISVHCELLTSKFT